MDECFVGGGFAVAAGRDPPSCFQPGVGSFDRPAVPSEWVSGLELSFASAADLTDDLFGRDSGAGFAPSADHRLDPSLGEVVAEDGGVVATVGPDLARVDPARDQRVDQRDQVSLLVFVAGRDAHLERQPRPVNG